MSTITQIAISHNRNSEFAIIGDENESISRPSFLVVQTPNEHCSGNYSRINLGHASKANIDLLIDSLQRLKVHADG